MRHVRREFSQTEDSASLRLVSSNRAKCHHCNRTTIGFGMIPEITIHVLHCWISTGRRSQKCNLAVADSLIKSAHFVSKSGGYKFLPVDLFLIAFHVSFRLTCVL